MAPCYLGVSRSQRMHNSYGAPRVLLWPTWILSFNYHVPSHRHQHRKLTAQEAITRDNVVWSSCGYLWHFQLGAPLSCILGKTVLLVAILVVRIGPTSPSS